jgi:hypothetical protein
MSLKIDIENVETFEALAIDLPPPSIPVPPAFLKPGALKLQPVALLT